MPGTRLRLRGKQNRFGFQVSTYDVGDGGETADFAPVYPATADLAQKTLRSVTESALPFARASGEPLPASVRFEERLPLRADALVGIHRPRGEDDAERARRRLALDELVDAAARAPSSTVDREALVAEALPPPGELAARYRAALPFTLTHAQEHAIAEIDADLGRTTPDAAPPPGRRRLG